MERKEETGNEEEETGEIRKEGGGAYEQSRERIMNLFEAGKIKLKRECIECGFKHSKGRNIGIFVPVDYLQGRYSEPDTPRTGPGSEEDLGEDGVADALDLAAAAPAPAPAASGGMFGAALAAPKTAVQKMEEARQAALAAKKNAEDKARGRVAEGEGEEGLEQKLHRKMTVKERAQARRARKEIGRPAEKLNTPRFISQVGYVRCNCFHGVPDDEPREYVAVPVIRFAGPIEIKAQYVKEPTWKRMSPSAEVLRLAEKFCDARTLMTAAMVSRNWCEASNEQPHYLDLKYMEAVASFEAHDGKIEDLFAYRGRVYTAGTKVVKVWGMTFDFNDVQQYDESGLEMHSLLHTPVRDTAIITKVVKANQSMYSAASNGAIREWILAHNIQNIKFTGAMWEHSGWVNHLVPSLPTPGTCSMHGVLNHVCLLYSSSDDRQVLVWDTITRKRIAKIEPPNKQCGTMRNMALSDRHMFIGSSNGIIYVYPYERTCERPDRHECSLEAGPKRFCLQTQLRHGAKAITALQVTGVDHSLDKLFSGSQDGTIAVFQLSSEGYEFETVAIFDQHKAAITAISSSWSHLYSSSDDGTVRVWNLRTFDVQKILKCGSRVKCIYVDEAEAVPEVDVVEDKPPPCGYLYCGLSNGFVFKWRIGTWM